MAKHPNYKHFYQVIKELREDFPTDLDVVVRRKRLKDLIGLASRGENCYYIYIDSTLDEDIAVYSLLHEWSHVYPYMMVGVDHGRDWAIRYAKIYRTYEKRHLITPKKK